MELLCLKLLPSFVKVSSNILGTYSVFKAGKVHNLDIRYYNWGSKRSKWK